MLIDQGSQASPVCLCRLPGYLWLQSFVGLYSWVRKKRRSGKRQKWKQKQKCPRNKQRQENDKEEKEYSKELELKWIERELQLRQKNQNRVQGRENNKESWIERTCYDF